MTLISRKFLQAQNSIIFIQSTFSILIWSIEKAEFTAEFMNFKLYFSVFLNEKLIIAQIQVEAHVMNNLKANFLLSIDNMIFEDIILDLLWKQAIFELCDNVIVKLNMIFKSNHQVHHSIYSDANVVVSSNLKMKILIWWCWSLIKLSSDRDYIFESASEQLVFYIYVMNVTLFFIYMINYTDWSVTVSWRTQIESLTKFDLTEAYLMNTNAFILALQTNKFSSKKTFHLSVSAEKSLFLNTNSTRAEIIILSRIIIYRE